MVTFSKTMICAVGTLVLAILIGVIIVSVLAGLKMFPGQEQVAVKNADGNSVSADILSQTGPRLRNSSSNITFQSVSQNVSLDSSFSRQNSSESQSISTPNPTEAERRQSPRANEVDNLKLQTGRAILRGEVLRNLRKGIPSKNQKLRAIQGSLQVKAIAPCPAMSISCAAFRVARSRPLRCTSHDQCDADYQCCSLACFGINICQPRINI
ncbi:hypothetical protein FHG87_001332 [Trinorchestia longiramus]|nr:hypothetical protein FHG87_001332 [Trinorchestia longiramus]